MPEAATRLQRVPVRKSARPAAPKGAPQGRSSTKAPTKPTPGPARRPRKSKPRGRGFQPGHDPRRNKAGNPSGRLAGFNGDVKQAVLDAFGELGGKEWLKKLAAKDKKTFASLLQKTIAQEVTGKGGGPLVEQHLVQVTQAIVNLPLADLEQFIGMLSRLGVPNTIPRALPAPAAP